MQYPVPQFTDVEDKIIGQFTLWQFAIVGGAGVVVFLIYSAFKSTIVLIICSIIFGVPALFVAFYQHTGIPLYKAFPRILKHFLSPKLYVFHKEIHTLPQSAVIKDVQQQKEAPKELSESEKRQRLKDISLFLERKALEENVIAQNPEQFNQKQPKLSDLFK